MLSALLPKIEMASMCLGISISGKQPRETIRDRRPDSETISYGLFRPIHQDLFEFVRYVRAKRSVSEGRKIRFISYGKRYCDKVPTSTDRPRTLFDVTKNKGKKARYSHTEPRKL